MIVKLEEKNGEFIVTVEPRDIELACKVQDAINKETHFIASVDESSLNINLDDQDFITELEPSEIQNFESFLKRIK